MVNMTVAISSKIYRIPYKLTLTKRCGDCHDNAFKTGNSDYWTAIGP